LIRTRGPLGKAINNVKGQTRWGKYGLNSAMAEPASISLILYKTVESVSFDNMGQNRNRILWPYT
jgi:hypothetical protein